MLSTAQWIIIGILHTKEKGKEARLYSSLSGTITKRKDERSTVS